MLEDPTCSELTTELKAVNGWKLSGHVTGAWMERCEIAATWKFHRKVPVFLGNCDREKGIKVMVQITDNLEIPGINLFLLPEL